MSARRTPPLKAVTEPKSTPTPRRPSRASAKKLEVVKPEFDRNAYKLSQLRNTVAQQAETIAELQAQNAEMVTFLQANAELLGLTIVDGNTPPPTTDASPEEEK